MYAKTAGIDADAAIDPRHCCCLGARLQQGVLQRLEKGLEVWTADGILGVNPLLFGHHEVFVEEIGHVVGDGGGGEL